jgi:methylase of polypeptide subunit release factors
MLRADETPPIQEAESRAPDLEASRAALVDLGRALRAAGYEFTTPTPATHHRVADRNGRGEARTLRDVFGWSRRFRPSVLPPAILALCEAAEILPPPDDAGYLTSRVRFSTLNAATGNFMFAHSAFPTTERDAVFFGPDSYRFAALLTRTVWDARRLVDVGCGAGVGGLVLSPRADEIVLADISPRALELAAINRALAGRDQATVALQQSDVLANVEGNFDVIVSNPPYLAGPDPASGQQARLYRDGGGSLGIDLSVRIVTESLARLHAGEGGQLVLYTGAPVIDGRNVLQDRLAPLLRSEASAFSWEELDPDVFGEELERPAYRDTERLSVVALIASVA